MPDNGVRSYMLPIFFDDLCHRCLRLGKPECHLHGAVEFAGSGQLGVRLLPPSRLGVQDAEAEVAVGDQRAHAEFVGQGEGLAIAGIGLFDLRGLTMRGNITEEAQGIRLPTAFLVGTEILKGTGGKRARLLQVAGAQMRLAQCGEQQCPDTHSAARGGLL
jgi:hypothetical protein